LRDRHIARIKCQIDRLLTRLGVAPKRKREY
jgi:hypothetical protein